MAIGVAIIGCAYGQYVLAPAFRADPRCKVVAIAASDGERARAAAAALGIERASAGWRPLIEDRVIDAILIATPPAIQSEIAICAFEQGKAVFAEKPMSSNLADAQEMTRCALASSRPNMMDFGFGEISAWKRARQILADGEIGTVHRVSVNWNTESYTNRMHLENWKSSSGQGGGALFNFVSHCLHYLEWFLGPITGLSSRLSQMPADIRTGDTAVAMALSFQSGACGSISMSAAAYLGTGHRVEFYGEDGTLVLENSTPDYMKGFKLLYGKRPQPQLEAVAVNDLEEASHKDGRVLPVSRLAHRFLDWVEKGIPARPDFRDGLRVQKLLDAARRSHQGGQWVDVSN
jgi:predicted dehydrogenase